MLEPTVPPYARDASTLRLENVSKWFDNVQAVRPLSLDIAAGELVALLGPSGCGKTTTLRMVAGFESPDTGSIMIGERDVTGLPTHRRRIGMVFQSYALFPHLTVGENVAFGLRMQRVGRAEREERVAQVLRTVRLEGFSQRYASQLSGGQQQRVALARSLVTNPAVLLLDEPLGALDKNLREGMQFELHQLQKALGITSVLVTHDQEEALTMADRVAVMNEGQILQIGNPTAIYDRPRTQFVAEFLGAANILPGKVVRSSAGRAEIDIGFGGASRIITLDEPRCFTPGDSALMAVRPEKLRLTPADSDGIAATVVDHVFRGSYHALKLRADGSDTAMVAYGGEAARDYRPGDRIAVSWAPDSLVLLDDKV